MCKHQCPRGSQEDTGTDVRREGERTVNELIKITCFASVHVVGT
jgi:hypothetical protein